MTISELVRRLSDLCVMNNLSYDRTPPVQVSPGVFMFNAVEMNMKCKSKGECRQRQLYVIVKGNELTLA